MKVKDKASDRIEDNPSSVRQWVGARLFAGEAYKAEPPDAVQSTQQHSNRYEKMSREDMQRPNRKGKRSNENRKRNRELPKGLSGGW